MATNDTYSHWRDSARTPQFFFVDARAAFGVLPVFFHPTWWTVGAAVVVLLIMGLLNYFNIPFLVACRFLRGLVSGNRKLIRVR